MATFECSTILCPNFGWVILIIVVTFILNFAQMITIGRARTKDKVPLPLMYQEGADTFNCAQRAHQNTLELVPFFLAMLVVGGLRYPEYAAGFGGAWILGRIIYSIGYIGGGPKWRVPGFIITMLGGMVPLMGVAIASAGYMLEWWDQPEV